MYFSPFFPSTAPKITALENVTKRYIPAALIPIKADIIAITIGFISGDATINDKISPNGAPPFNSPKAMGMVEHAHKGVSPPIKAPRMFPYIPVRGIQELILFLGKYISKNSTTMLITMNKIVSSLTIDKK
jgi:hypothetical protein